MEDREGMMGMATEEAGVEEVVVMVVVVVEVVDSEGVGEGDSVEIGNALGGSAFMGRSWG